MRNKSITPAQLKALQTLFSRKGFTSEERHEFIQGFTNGRTLSSKELSMYEAQQILQGFNIESSPDKRHSNNDEAESLVASIFYLSSQISILNKGFAYDNTDDYEMNKAKIKQFSRKHSACRKEYTKMSIDELRAFKKQLEALARKEYE